MKKLKFPINTELLQDRLLDIEKSLVRLEELQKEYNSLEKFLQNKDAYGLAEHPSRT